MRFQDAFFTTQGERKRQRTPNSRFQKDYVALPGLRTTAKSTWEQRSHKGKWSHGEASMTNECTELTVDVEGRLFVCVCVCVSKLVRFGDLGIAIYILTLAHTSFLWKVLRKWCKGGLNEVMWIRWMLTCVCFYILHQWLNGVTGRGGVLIGLLQNGLTEGIVASVA